MLGTGGGETVAIYYDFNKHKEHTRSDIIVWKKDFESRLESNTWASRTLTGSAFGRPWKQASIASFKNCILITLACWLDTERKMSANSILRAQMARWASRDADGINPV
jgi:hypothetical protein